MTAHTIIKDEPEVHPVYAGYYIITYRGKTYVSRETVDGYDLYCWGESLLEGGLYDGYAAADWLREQDGVTCPKCNGKGGWRGHNIRGDEQEADCDACNGTGSTG